MDSTLQQLRSLLVQAIPTILFFSLLTVYLRSVFFRPIARIFEDRRKATEGVRELAQQALAAADKKSSEFEQAIRIARNQIHQEHEAQRKQWLDEQAQQIAAARAQADESIARAKQDIAEELKSAEAELNVQIESLARQISDTLLRRRAA